MQLCKISPTCNLWSRVKTSPLPIAIDASTWLATWTDNASQVFAWLEVNVMLAQTLMPKVETVNVKEINALETMNASWTYATTHFVMQAGLANGAEKIKMEVSLLLSYSPAYLVAFLSFHSVLSFIFAAKRRSSLCDYFTCKQLTRQRKYLKEHNLKKWLLCLRHMEDSRSWLDMGNHFSFRNRLTLSSCDINYLYWYLKLLLLLLLIK